MTDRVYNFSAGPAVLPEPVLAQVRDEMMALPGLGMSVLEISHRSPAFAQILSETESHLRQLLDIPANYQVLFLQGGGRLQFSMVPMNFAGSHGDGHYIVSGSWSKKAVQEATNLGATRVAWQCPAGTFQRVPTNDELDLDPNGGFLYYTSNETIQGVQFAAEPDAGGMPLICDASSDFMCRPIDVSKYAMIYACAQKNAGPAGVTIVIIRDDMLEKCSDKLPGYLNYREHAQANSMYNTPPTFSIYVVNLVAKWLLEEVGGLTEMQALNLKKSAMLYEVLDELDFYTGHADTNSRSLMNVTFRLPSDELQSQFLANAADRGLVNLKGHRSVGGIRASIYNSMPVSGVEHLRDYLRQFANEKA